MIRVRNLIKSANRIRILRGVSFDVAPQTVLGIIGASGSGKTTLLRCLNGLERIDEGEIECGDVHLDAKLSKHEYTRRVAQLHIDRKSTRLNSSHSQISYAVFCLKKKKK